MKTATGKKKIGSFTILTIFVGIIFIACILIVIYPQFRIRINTNNIVRYRISEFNWEEGISERSRVFEEKKEIEDVTKIIKEYQSKGFSFYSQFTSGFVPTTEFQDLKNLDIRVEYSNGQTVYYQLYAEGLGENFDAGMTINFDEEVSRKFYDAILNLLN